MKLSDYHGNVSKCPCSNPDTPGPCTICFARGYLAECLACNGSGQVENGLAGAPGKMRSTCTPCGGKGHYAVKKPENFEAIAEAIRQAKAEMFGHGLPAAQHESEPSHAAVA